ncbi:MAG: mechanosensitive ion channel family protein [Rhodobacterales bacterium]
MDQDITTDDAIEVALGLLSQGELFLESLLRPWNAYQIGIVLALFLAAHLFARILAPRLSEWLRTREGWPKWRMRLVITLRNRLRLILFVAMIWPIVWVMQEVTLPERSQLMSAVAQLTLAWLLIAILTRIIGNAFLRSLVRYVGWAWVSLSILGVIEDITSILDRIAIEIGDIRLSLWMILQAMMLLAVLFALARFITKQSIRRIQSNEDISPSMQVLAVKALQVGLYGAAVFVGLRVVGVDLTGLAVLSGAIGLGLGFGLQKVVSNLVSGVIILLDKSIKPGDVISLGETFGWINSLGARYVSVVTRDGREYLIPNEDLITGQVVNWSHSNEFVRLDINFGTAYADDPHLVRRVAIEASLSVDRVLDFKSPVCHIVGFGDSSVDYVLRFWIKDPTQGLTNIRGNVYLALWDAFKVNGISIPFPQREVRMLGQGPQDASTQAGD